MPVAVASSQVVAYEGLIYFLGGRETDATATTHLPTSVVQVFDTNDYTWVASSDPDSLIPPLPLPRASAGPALEINGKLAIFGGRELPLGTHDALVVDTILLYDPYDATWMDADVTLPIPLVVSWPVLYGDDVLLPGGTSLTGK